MDLICVRCHGPVVASAQHYDVFERMHWICFHLEYEHNADPDLPCDDPSCLWRRPAAPDAARDVVKSATRVVTFGGEGPSGWLPPGAAVPKATPQVDVQLRLSIVREDDAGFLLVWEGPNRRYCGDTWHSSVAEAVEQAQRSFGVSPDEWQ
jgi:hypothetical protein